MKIVPVDACIKRFYRGYVKVKDDATDDEIREAATEAILNDLDGAFDLSPEMLIEDNDIVFIDPDEEGSWTEEEDEEIAEILKHKEV